MQPERDKQHCISNLLQDSEALLRAMIENLPRGAAFVVDPDLRYWLAEAEALSAAGFKPEDLVGRTIFEVFPPELAASYEVEYRKAFAGETFELEHEAHDHCYISRGTPLRSANDQVYAVLVVSYDITERKRAEAAVAADLEDMQRLRELSARLVTEDDIQAIYKEIVATALALTRADAGTVQILDEATQDLLVLASGGFEQTMLDHFYRVNAGSNTFCGIAVATGDRAFIDFDVPESEDPDGSIQLHLEAGYRSAQSTPLISGSGKAQGVVSTHWRKYHRPTERELRFLNLLARQAADLIEQRQAQVALRSSERRLQASQNNVGVGIHELDEMGRYLGINETFTRLSGYTLADFANRTIFDDIPSSDRDKARENYGRLVRGEIDSYVDEQTYVTRDGSCAWVEVLTTAVRDEEGRFLYAVRAIHDVTQRKNAEVALRESEEKFRMLFNSIDEGFCIMEVVANDRGEITDLYFRQVNSAFEQHTGLSHVVGKTVSELLPNFEQHWIDIYQHVWETGEPRRAENYVADVDRWYRVHHFRVGSAGSPFVGVVFEDITDRKRAEKALRESEEKYRLRLEEEVRERTAELNKTKDLLQTIFDTSPNSITTYKPVYNNNQIDDFQIVFVNAFTEKTAGVNPTGLLLTQTFPTAKQNGFFDRLKDVIEQKQMQDFELWYEGEGMHNWFRMIAVPMEGMVLVTTEDITERKQAQGEILRLRDEVAQKATDNYYTLFNTIDEGISVLELIYDDSGKPVDMRWIEANPAFEKITGLKNVAGRLTSEFVPTEDYWLETYDRVLKTGEPVRYENYHAGIKQWYRTHTSRMGGPESRQVVNIFEDITSRKRRELNIAFLDEIGKDLSLLSTPDDIIQTVGARLGEFLQVSGCIFADVDEAKNEATIHHGWNTTDVPSLKQTFRLADYFGEEFARADRAGETVIVRDTARDERANAEAYARLKLGGFVTVPFHWRGRWTANITVTSREARDWRADEIELLQEIASRVFPRIDRARAEEALRESEQRLSVIFAQAAVGLSEISLDGRFEQVNDAICQMLGRSRSELLAATVPDVTPPDDVPKILGALAQVIETGESVSLDKRYLRSDGTVLWATSILTRLDNSQGQPQHILAVTIDLSDRKQAEAERLQRIQEQAAREEEHQRAEALAELDRAKTLFFSNVSHEFRTPLTLILAPLQDALSDSNNPLPPAQLKRLELAHRNSLRLLKLVNTLLDFSRIEAGRMEAVYEATDLALLTTELASVFRSAIEQAGLRLVVDCPPLTEPVYVDRQMWEKIVLNLLSNAFKFTLEGEIKVRLHKADEHYVKLQIEDTGAGIDPEELSHLFERFYQVRGAIARTHEGSGIGLALVYELIKMHGGTIEVSSTVGQGSCFTVTIPLGTGHLPSDRHRLVVGSHTQATRTLTSTASIAAPYVQEAERWLPQESTKLKVLSAENIEETKYDSRLTRTDAINRVSTFSTHHSVLIVDDNADMRDYLKRILSEHVEVEAVANGADALATINQRVPDLVLSDVMMPSLDGFELLKALRADPRTKEVPIILLSARAGEESIIEGLEAGADDYLIKPFRATELVTRVNAYLLLANLRSEALRQERTINRRKDEVLSTVSHELNAPLVAILGWTRLLRSSPSNQTMLMKSLDTIERNATLQAKLVQDLLDISRITADKICLNIEPVELQQVISQALATVHQSLETKDIRAYCLLSPSPIIIQGDSERLQQIFLNLLSNAVKFTPEGGRIEVSLQTNENQAEIIFSDTGCGIDAEFLPYIFDTFRQAPGIKKGLGLGLAIARSLVELHSGTIHAKSPGIGQGATFIVTLPLINS